MFRQPALAADENVTVPESQALPVLSADLLTSLLSRIQSEGQYEILLAFEEWPSSQQI